MAHYIEYTLQDGTSIQIEACESISVEDSGIVRASRFSGKDVIYQAKINFEDGIHSAKQLANNLKQQLSDVAADEVEVRFALKATAELGFAVGKVGAEANFEVTLKWSNSSSSTGK